MEAPGAARDENRWGTEMGKVLLGQHEFYPEGYKPPFSAEECLKHLLFAGKPTPAMVFELADLMSRSLPHENRGHVMVIYAYTVESFLYKRVTSCMRRMASSELVHWQPFIFHMERALRERPVVRGPVYRGVSVRLGSHIYKENSTITWQSFTSATCRVEVVEKFLKQEGNKRAGTVAIIESVGARDIQDFSHFGTDEEEVVFLPNTQFRVTGVAVGKAIVTRLLPELDAYDLTDLKVLSLKELSSNAVAAPLATAPVGSIAEHVAVAAAPSANAAASTTDQAVDATKQMAWEWLDDFSAWQRFRDVDSNLLEAAFQTGERIFATRNLSFNPSCPYTVDFTGMVQVNHQTKKSRNIRRVEKQSKMLDAGLGVAAPKSLDGPSTKLQQLEYRFGKEAVSCLKGAYNFFPPGYVPPCKAEGCLKQLDFKGHKRLLELSRNVAASYPPPRRSNVMLIYFFVADAEPYRILMHLMTMFEKEELLPWLPYMYHLDRALASQPIFQGRTYWFQPCKSSELIYAPGSIVTWQAFSSSTRDSLQGWDLLAQTKSDLGRTAFHGAAFAIETRTGADVEKISRPPGAVVLRPNTQFRVRAVACTEAEKLDIFPAFETFVLDDLQVFLLDEL